jgi:hypothetical protein
MKLKKKRVENEEGESSLGKLINRDEGASNDSEGPSWAETDATKFKRLSKEAKTAGRRAPEIWIGENQSKTIRLVDEKPIAAFKVYKKRINGKWQTFVAPAPGKPDLFASALGLKASQIFLWRAIDIDGYKNKEGKVFTNQPRFYPTSTRTFDQLQMLSEENSDAGKINEYNIKISRTGTGTNTTYMFMPKPPSPLTPEMKKAAAAFPKWAEYYRPYSTAQQESLVLSLGGSVGNDDNEE